MAPRSAAHDVVGRVVAALATLGAGTPRRAAVVFAPPADADRCTDPVTLPVALRVRGARVRPGRAALAFTGKAAGRGADRDQLKLLCVPAS
jgi:hypothetical protein